MIWKCEPGDIPGNISHIHSPPGQLYISASSRDCFDQLMARPRIAIVGTRKVTSYGSSVTARLAGELSAYGIVIISGLALGIDSIAHRAVLEANGLTMAVLPSPVEDVCPHSHQWLARDIIAHSGALVSEYAAGEVPLKQNFVARNRIVAGLADALLITEAAENSGTMHTATFANEQGITVLAVPGNIDSPTSTGTNNLIKGGATPVTSTADILYHFNIPRATTDTPRKRRVRGANPAEQTILNLLEQGIYDGAELLYRSTLDITAYNSCMTMLEITAKIRPLGANQWTIA
jgi:DNA processing protein